MIYFITDGVGHVKIGYSAKSPERRLQNFQVGNAQRLSIVAEVPGDRRFEKRIHHAFSDLHVGGEWFRQEGELSVMLHSLAAADEGQRGAVLAEMLPDAKPAVRCETAVEWDKDAERTIMVACTHAWIEKHGYDRFRKVSRLCEAQGRNIKAGKSVLSPLPAMRLMKFDFGPFQDLFDGKIAALPCAEEQEAQRRIASLARLFRTCVTALNIRARELLEGEGPAEIMRRHASAIVEAARQVRA